MSQGGDSFGPNPYSSNDGTPPKRGMSTAVKVLLILGGIFGVLAALCCGGGFYLFNRIKNAVTTDPVQVTAIQQKIMSIDIPEGFTPQSGMDIGLGPVKIKFAVYLHGTPGDKQSGAEMLMLMQMPGGESDAQAQEKMQEQMEKQGQTKNLKVQSQETRKIKIDGRDVSFQFIQGTQGESGPAMRQVLGVFPGREGTNNMVMYMAPEDRWDEEEVMTMLKSIKVKEE